MLRYIARKAVGWFLMIVVATNLTYFLANAFLKPASNYTALRPPRTPAEINHSLSLYNLNPNKPIMDRWWDWITGIVAHWDWGQSPTGGSVNGEVSYRIIVSGELVIASTILAVVIGIALGVYTASRQYKAGDRVWQGISVISFNTPSAVAALGVVALTIALNQRLGKTLLPVSGAENTDVSGFWDTLGSRATHAILPTISLTFISYAGYHLLQRSLLLDNINSDYVRTARSKGLTRQQAIYRHGLRTSVIPVATQVAFAMPALFTGAVITETVFAWHGMGEYFSTTISKNDVHGVVAVAAFGALMTAVGAILSDLVIVALDPRIRVS
ncbi:MULTISPECIES: ABC transporter permease [unclassified Streptomyces]|uniref:ABC transporter permease n=1 Tax=unclassified Streptomyces TaxID=2593676 RepID=UPI0013E97402|nr:MULTISPECIES: ABC transporter permease [unclassified Streptomyces]WEH30494.1 ABC transporter permease [Streptomyces sp. AM 3-1-1]